jgi:hypothetical protein
MDGIKSVFWATPWSLHTHTQLSTPLYLFSALLCYNRNSSFIEKFVCCFIAPAFLIQRANPNTAKFAFSPRLISLSTILPIYLATLPKLPEHFFNTIICSLTQAASEVTTPKRPHITAPFVLQDSPRPHTPLNLWKSADLHIYTSPDPDFFSTPIDGC